ncbi:MULTISPECIES: Exc2 family lipoprotein [unclassified Serratia (in: enterobacteria)]|uniref:Exc2 family lipoprotein n=1 Tax=unclassified Serratia (in: enterobacteria) TaxID=2647522 RepID=UPI0005030ADC|nr:MULTISPECIES: Exc2 family lipoprotein [unclassified Serratia (in: enterobacteria)]KFK92415.1 entry exclusion protein 2 [Serratia sp. Ag2]KFK98491.1 entry exclusion protein 2 [Serratia sp. Ag1]
MVFTVPRPLVLLTTLCLSACSSPQSSPERHAKRAVYQLDQAHFDPNTRMSISDSIKQAIPFFDQFYQMGKADRAKGLTRQQAEQREAYFRSAEFLQESKQKSVFMQHEYSADNPQKQRQILLNAGVAAYWDGYEGRS